MNIPALFSPERRDERLRRSDRSHQVGVDHAQHLLVGETFERAGNPIPQWPRPVAFVGHGGVGGPRGGGLRLTTIEVQMAPIRTAVQIQVPVYLAVLKESKKLSDFDFLSEAARDMLDHLGMAELNALRVAPGRSACAIASDRIEPRGETVVPIDVFDGGAQWMMSRPSGPICLTTPGAKTAASLHLWTRSWARSASPSPRGSTTGRQVPLSRQVSPVPTLSSHLRCSRRVADTRCGKAGMDCRHHLGTLAHRGQPRVF